MNNYQKKIALILNKLSRKMVVHYFHKISSTSTYARERLNEENDRFLVISDIQTSGRGRKGHSFFSPKGGVYFTYALEYQDNLNLDYITLIGANAVIRSLEQLGIKAKIKWVNDIYYDNKKCGGILSELVFSSDNKKWFLVGIGININIKKINPEIKDIACSITIDDFDSTKLISSIINNIDNLLLQSEKEIVEEYRGYCLLIGKEIYFIHEGIQEHGLVKSISDDGGLIVDVQGQVKVLRSGEVSLSSSSISKILNK